jgi:hypothetical protein
MLSDDSDAVNSDSGLDEEYQTDLTSKGEDRLEDGNEALLPSSHT